MPFNRLQQFATGRMVAATLVAWLGIAVAFFTFSPYALIAEAGQPESLLEERFGYSADDAGLWLEKIGPELRAAYQTFQVLDSANAIVTAAALALALTFTLTRLFPGQPRIGLLAWLPGVVLLLEFGENALLFGAAAAWPELSEGWLKLASTLTVSKLTLSMVVFPLTGLSFMALFAKWLLGKLR